MRNDNEEAQRKKERKKERKREVEKGLPEHNNHLYFGVY